MGYFRVRYDSRVVIYVREMFIRLATVLNTHRNTAKTLSISKDVELKPFLFAADHHRINRKWLVRLDVASHRLRCIQCDQIGRFLQTLGNKLSLTKVAQIFWWLFGLFLIMSLLCKKFVAAFGHFWEEVRPLFIQSGHTACIDTSTLVGVVTGRSSGSTKTRNRLFLIFITYSTSNRITIDDRKKPYSLPT